MHYVASVAYYVELVVLSVYLFPLTDAVTAILELAVYTLVGG